MNLPLTVECDVHFERRGQAHELPGADRRDEPEELLDLAQRSDSASDALRGNAQRDKDQGEGRPVRKDGPGQVHGERVKGGAHPTFDAHSEADLKAGSVLPDLASART